MEQELRNFLLPCPRKIKRVITDPERGIRVVGRGVLSFCRLPPATSIMSPFFLDSEILSQVPTNPTTLRAGFARLCQYCTMLHEDMENTGLHNVMGLWILLRLMTH